MFFLIINALYALFYRYIYAYNIYYVKYIISIYYNIYLYISVFYRYLLMLFILLAKNFTIFRYFQIDKLLENSRIS